MNFKKISKYLSIFLSGTILSSTISFANLIDENSYSIPISQGVTFTKTEQIFTNKANSIYMTIADLNNPSLALDLLYNKTTGFTNRKKLSELDLQNPNSVVSINGDFFSMSSPSYAMGTMIENGKIISNPAYTGNMATMIIDDTNKIFFEYLSSSVSIKNENKAQSILGASINKISNTYQNPIIITDEFRKSTIGSNANLELTEVIVENDIVREIRIGESPTTLDENTYAIVASGIKAIELANNFEIGDKVTIVSSAKNTFENIKTAIGGGTLILKNGELTPLTHTIAGKSQRTAVGITFDNKIIFMVVDGRTSSYQGMNESEVANFLKTQNVKDAMMFDGGGSSEMIINKKIANIISAERQIVNAISITNNEQRGNLSKIIAALETKNITQNDKVKLIAQGFDYNMNPVSLNNITVNGLGSEYKDGYVTFKQAGEGKITISSSGISTSIDVKVEKIEKLDPYLKESTGNTDFLLIPNSSANKEDILAQAVNGKTLEKTEKTKLAINIYNQNGEFIDQIKTRKENINAPNQTLKTSNAILLSISNKKGISAVEKQWDNIKSALKTDKQNVILILDAKLELTPTEKRIIRKMISESKKKVFVVSFGDKFESYTEGNASYITITDNSKTNQEYKLLGFRTQNGKLVYSFENIF